MYIRKIDNEVITYLDDKFKNLKIEILGDFEGALFELMRQGALEGWCWETTETAILFLNDDDYIERGYLNLNEKQPNYYHSWICFKYKDKEYVLDPCLNTICYKKDYEEMFEPIVMGKVTSLEVRTELLKQIESYGDKKINNTSLAMLHKIIYGDAKKSEDIEVHVDAPDNVKTPLYRNGAGYKTEIENGKIKKLTVHYYISEY